MSNTATDHGSCCTTAFGNLLGVTVMIGLAQNNHSVIRNQVFKSTVPVDGLIGEQPGKSFISLEDN